MKNFIYIFIVFLWACSSKKEIETPAQEESNIVTITETQFKTLGMQWTNLQSKKISNYLEVSGKLDVPPQNLVSIHALMGGFIRQTDLLQGSKVSQGQVLAMIENPDLIQLQQDYSESKSRLDYLKAEYTRQDELRQANANALKTFQQVTADYKSLQAKVAALEKRLAMVNISPFALQNNNFTSQYAIYAPISGIVTDVHVNLGKYVQATDVLFEIANTQHLHAELTVFEKDISYLKEGQSVSVQLANEPNQHRAARIYLINRKIETDRTVRVHAHLEAEDIALLPNTFLKAKIYIENNEKMALSEAAIVQFEGKDYVFILQNQNKSNLQFEMIPIQKGNSEQGFVAVIFLNKKDYTQTKFAGEGAYRLLAKLKNKEEE